MSFFDQVEMVHQARAQGREAACSGLVKGENPKSCSACRRQWNLGFDEGRDVMMRVPMIAVIR